MDYLYRLGHRHIGIITGPLVSPLSRDRLRGATARAKQQKAERDFVVMNGDFSIESGAVGAERLLGRREPPTAIFCFNDEMAMGAVETAQAPRPARAARRLDRRLRRHPLRALHRSAADHRRAADARDRRGHRARCCWRS